MSDPDVIATHEFSGFHLDGGSRRLTDPNGASVALTTKAFDALAYLVANPGRVVDKQELLDAVWPGIAVEENTLNHAISAARRALGDGRTEPRFIATIQGRGYQFVAPVRVVEANSANRSDVDAMAAASSKPASAVTLLERLGGRGLGVLGVIAGILVLAVVVFPLMGYLAGRQSNPEAAARYQVGRTEWLTRDSMLELDPAYSPDGRFFAYAAGPIGQTDIYVQPVTGGAPHNLTAGLEGAHGWPRWSPHGEQIAFRTVSPRSLDIIHIVPALGGEAQPVVREPFLTGHDWSPDGADIVYTRASSLYVYSLADGDAVQLPVDVPEPHSPTYSPDGSKIAFVSDNSAFVFAVSGFANIAPSAIWVVAADGSAARQVTDKTSLNTSPVWADDSRSLFFISDRDGDRALYQASLPGADLEPQDPRFLTRLNVHTMSRSPDGGGLIYADLVASRANIWALPIPGDGPLPTAPTPDMATPITTGNQMIEGMDVSSDGQWLLFDSSLRGNQDIYKLNLTNDWIGDPIQLTFDPSDDFSATWSPDGRHVAFHSLRNGNRDIFMMSADGLGEQPLTTGAPEERYPDWSPDGNRIAFFSDSAGRWQVFTVARRGEGSGWTAPEQVTYDLGWYPKWSPIEDLVAYTTLDGAATTIALLTPDKDSTTFDLGPEIDGLYPVWAPDGSRIYFKGTSADGIGIWSIKPDGSELTQHLSFRNLAAGGTPRVEFAVSDSHFYFTLSEHDSDIKTLELVEL